MAEPSEWAMKKAGELLAYDRDRYHNALVLDAARKEANEAAATEADRLWVGTKGKSIVAAAIRALIDKPPAPPDDG